MSSRPTKFPTWKYRYFRISYFERNRDSFGLGIEYFEPHGRKDFGELSLTIWRWEITWKIGRKRGE